MKSGLFVARITGERRFSSDHPGGGEAPIPSMDITLKKSFAVPSYVKDLEIACQVSISFIERCEDAAFQEVMMVLKDIAHNSFRMTLDARAVNAGRTCYMPLGAKSYYDCRDLLSTYR
jgi:hypothetical protein